MRDVSGERRQRWLLTKWARACRRVRSIAGSMRFGQDTINTESVTNITNISTVGTPCGTTTEVQFRGTNGSNYGIFDCDARIIVTKALGQVIFDRSLSATTSSTVFASGAFLPALRVRGDTPTSGSVYDLMSAWIPFPAAPASTQNTYALVLGGTPGTGAPANGSIFSLYAEARGDTAQTFAIIDHFLGVGGGLSGFRTRAASATDSNPPNFTIDARDGLSSSSSATIGIGWSKLGNSVDDTIGTLQFYGTGATLSVSKNFARITAHADADATANAFRPSRLTFWTTPNTSGAAQAERLRIKADGTVEIAVGTDFVVHSGDVVTHNDDVVLNWTH